MKSQDNYLWSVKDDDYSIDANNEKLARNKNNPFIKKESNARQYVNQ